MNRLREVVTSVLKSVFTKQEPDVRTQFQRKRSAIAGAVSTKPLDGLYRRQKNLTNSSNTIGSCDCTKLNPVKTMEWGPQEPVAQQGEGETRPSAIVWKEKSIRLPIAARLLQLSPAKSPPPPVPIGFAFSPFHV